MDKKTNLSLIKNKELGASEAFFKEFSKLMSLYNDEKHCYYTKTIKELKSPEDLIFFVGESFGIIMTALEDDGNKEINPSRKYSAEELLGILKRHINKKIGKEVEISEEGEKLVYRYKGQVEKHLPKVNETPNTKNEDEIKKETNIDILKKSGKSEQFKEFLTALDYYRTKHKNVELNIEKIHINRLTTLIENQEEYKQNELVELFTTNIFLKISTRLNIEKLKIIIRQSEHIYLKNFLKNTNNIEKTVDFIDKINPNIFSYIVNQTSNRYLIEKIESEDIEKLIYMSENAQSYNLEENDKIINKKEVEVEMKNKNPLKKDKPNFITFIKKFFKR